MKHWQCAGIIRTHFLRKENDMDISLIFGGEATLEDLIELHDEKGFSFAIGDGEITEVIFE